MLENIKCPKDVQALSDRDVKVLCTEIREKILSSMTENGGHLASNLGMVEATVALHRAFSSPEDSIVFDVGHQCYTHKLLTGRYDEFGTVRSFGGLSGFTSRQESVHDVLTAGHSGSALPTALGIARANALEKNGNFAVAVIGDGSFTNGMVYETINSCTDKGLPLVILLNDNEMSISKNVGGVPKYFSRLRNSRKYFKLKKYVQSFFGHIPLIGKYLVTAAYKTKEFFKHLLLHTNFFESMGLYYLGPVDGHDAKKLEAVLKEAKTKEKCTVVHMITKKGKGYEPAEKHPDQYHFSSLSGETVTAETFSSVFGKKLCEAAEKSPDVVGVTAAMDKGTGMSEFKKKYPDRFFDVGIAEEAAVTFSSGLAVGGKVPVLALYSTFMQRCFDQLCEDVALQDVHVVLGIDRAGLVPGDGVTHQGVFDVSLLSAVPKLTLYSPETFAELSECFDNCIEGTGLCCVRYPKGTERKTPLEGINVSGSADVKIYDLSNSAPDTVIITYGRIFDNAVKAAKMLTDRNIRIVKAVKLLPCPTDEIIEAVGDAKHVLILEEGMRRGGVSGIVLEALTKSGKTPKILVKAIDTFVPHGTVDELEHYCGLDPDAICNDIKEKLS